MVDKERRKGRGGQTFENGGQKKSNDPLLRYLRWPLQSRWHFK